MKKYLKGEMFRYQLLAVLFSIPFYLFAQDGDQTIKLTLTQNDSTKVCTAVVLESDAKPAQGIAVNFYIKRSVGLLPIATMEKTDDNGEASTIFPTTIPGDSLGNVTVIARLEDDEAIMDQKIISWGTKVKYSSEIDQRTMWGSRSNAPTYLIIISNAIILGIWGTMGFILFQLFFKIRKRGLVTNHKTNQ
jgi:hypothetical protein